MKNFFILILICIFSTSCEYIASRKFQKSIEIIDSYEGLTDLDLEEGSEDWMLPVVNDSIISYLLSKRSLMDSIEDLSIINCPAITSEGYKKLATLKNLRILKLEKLPINNADVNMLLDNLNSLGIVYFTDNEHMDSIHISERKQALDVKFSGCNQVRSVYGENNPHHLSITFDESLGDHETAINMKSSKGVYLGFIKENITDSLKIRIDSTASGYLHFLSCRFDENNRFFSSLSNVTEINISRALTERLVFSDLQKLKTLNIDHFGDDEGGELLQHVIIKNVPSLTYLGIRNEHLEGLQAKGTDSLGVLYLYTAKQNFNIQGIDELKALYSFEKNGAILNDLLFEQVLRLPLITDFGYGVDTLTDKQLTHIALSKKIKELSISPLLRESDLDRMLQMDSLVSLDIGGSPIKTIRIDSHPTLRKFKARGIYEFEELEITNCNLLEELSLEIIYPEKAEIRNVPNLTTLELGLCGFDDYEGFQEQLNKISSLTHITLETCNKPVDLRQLKNLEWAWFKNGQSEVIFNKDLEDSVYTNDYRGAVEYR